MSVSKYDNVIDRYLILRLSRSVNDRENPLLGSRCAGVPVGTIYGPHKQQDSTWGIKKFPHSAIFKEHAILYLTWFFHSMSRKKKGKRRKKNNRSAQTNKAQDSKQSQLPSAPSEPSATQRVSKSPAPKIVGGLCILAIAAVLIIWGPRWFGDPRGSSEIANTDSNLTVPRSGDRSWDEFDDASQDGWQTETFSDKANAQLKKLGKLLVDRTQTVGETISESKLTKLAVDQFLCTHLKPPEGALNTVFQDQTITVQRAYVDQIPVAGHYQARAGLVKALESLSAPFAGAEDVRFKFKLFRVEPSDSEIVTRQYFAISGRTPEGFREQNSTWVTTWDTKDSTKSQADPKLKRISVVDFEEVFTRGDGKPLYSDVTQSALEKNKSYREQLLRGYNHWLDRTESRPYWERLGTPGLAIGDVNGDGLDDLYLCQERGIPNLLFLQKSDGSVQDISQQAGVDWLEDSRSALLLDLDNDGDQDLVVGVAGGVVLAENDGQAGFEIRTVLPTSDDVKSLSAVDFNQDGRLDLYATVYYQNAFDSGVENTGLAAANMNQVIYDSNQGGGNSLYQNEIDDESWKFNDVTEQVGLNDKNARYSLAATWEDFDNDGDQDLYVANDYGRNNMYRNDAGQFVEIAGEAGVEDFNLAMSVTWGDYDRDAQMDIYVGNMFSAAGNRVTFQRQFRPDSSSDEIERFKHMARGNTLFKNLGDGKFSDVSDDSGVTIGRWAWSTNFLDLNNDGWQDLLVANGMITTEDTGDC